MIIEFENIGDTVDIRTPSGKRFTISVFKNGFGSDDLDVCKC